MLNSLNYEYSTATRGIQDVEKLHAQNSWVQMGDRNKDLLSRNRMSEMRLCSDKDPQIGSDQVWKANKITEVFWITSCISYQFKADVQTYDHRLRCTAGNNAAETDVSAQKMPGCCSLNDTGNKILFKIKWRRVNQGLNVGPIGRSPLVWGPVTWKAKPLSRTVQSSDCCKWQWDVHSEEDLIARTAGAAATIRQQPGIFWALTSVSAALLPAVHRSRWS